MTISLGRWWSKPSEGRDEDARGCSGRAMGSIIGSVIPI